MREVLLNSVIKLPDDELITTLTALGREEGDVAQLRADCFKMESDIDNLLKDGFEKKHPRILALRAELARKNQQITDLIAGIRRGLAVDADMAKSRVDLLSKEVDDLTTRVRENQTNGVVPFREAERQLDEQQTVLDALTVRLKQVVADTPLQESPVRIISRADVPEYPSKPNKSPEHGRQRAGRAVRGHRRRLSD